MVESTSIDSTPRVELSPETVAALYSAGMCVNDIAIMYHEPYSRIRRLLRESGTPVRDASARLKGRTRRSKGAASSTATSTEAQASESSSADQG